MRAYFGNGGLGDMVAIRLREPLRRWGEKVRV